MDLKAKGSGAPNKLARAIVAAVLSNEPNIAIKAVGASAVNNAVKAAAIARETLLRRGYDITLKPRFDRFDRDGEEWSLIALDVLVSELSDAEDGASGDDE